jgi:starch synthase (maltosyl-transferring)
MNSLRFHYVDHDQVIAFTHHCTVQTESGPVNDTLLVVVNLTPDEICEATVYLDLDALGLGGKSTLTVHDELTAETWQWGTTGNYVRFDPAERVAHIFSLTD